MAAGCQTQSNGSVAVANRADTVVQVVQYGQKLAPIKLQGESGWLQFHGNSSDQIVLKVSAQQGYAVAVLFDGEYNVVASNDDGSPSSVAQLKATLPATGDYYILFHELSFATASFDVTLDLVITPDFYSCTRDSDCVAVPKVGCCHNGYLEAVNANRADAYESSFVCDQTAPICPNFYIKDARVAECSNVSHKCEMIDPSAIQCKGFYANAHECPTGYACQLKPQMPDIPGHCAAQN
jgi:hypothetical protein